MRLESPDTGWTNQGFTAKHTRSYDNLNQWTGNGNQKPMSKSDDLLEDIFLPVYKQESEVIDSQFSVLCVIAKGAFGDVLKVRNIRDNAVYAMKVANKVMQKKKLLAEGAVQQSKDEATIQDAVGYHPLIVKPFCFFQNTSSVCIIMEYIPGGELFTAWKQSGNFSESLVRIYVAELATVLEDAINLAMNSVLNNDEKEKFKEHLQSVAVALGYPTNRSGIIYRDLKMENILLDNRGHVHITDFGLAKRLKKGQRTNTICGTLQYIAPEVVNGKAYGHSSDWWSLGILMYVLLVGQFPISGIKNHFEMAKRMTGVQYELPINYNFSPKVRHLVKLLLETSPERRLNDLNQMKQHKFFDGFDFDGVYQLELKTQGASAWSMVRPNNHQASDMVKSSRNVTQDERARLISGQRVPPSGPNITADPTANRQRVNYNRPNSGLALPYSTVRDGFFPAVMKEVKVASVDKRLQDHAKLFNIHLELWNRLNEKVEELRKMFSEENHKSTLNGTFAYLHKVCKNYSSFSVTRPYAYCLEINYDGREIPHSIIPAFISFNLANRTIKEILDKGPSLTRSVRMVLDNSKELRREVLVASLGPGMEDALTNCQENLETLEIILMRVDEIESKTKKIFEEFLTFQADFHALSI